MPYLKEARDNGAFIVVIDPRATTVARQADVHLAVRPGTDLPVALAIHRYLFEEGHADQAFLDAHTNGAAALREKAAPWTFERAAEVSGIDPAVVAQVAERYAKTSPALVKCGWGLERNRNGGSAAAAVLALPAVAGKFGVRGGGYSMSNSASWNIERTWADDPEPPTRAINMNKVGRVLTEPEGTPVNVLFVYNCNPVAILPDQRRVIRGLEREDLFTVVFDQVLTDTAMYADVVLPATTFLEHYDYGSRLRSHHAAAGEARDRSVGESRSNTDVFMDLARRLELTTDSDPQDDLDAMLTMLGQLPQQIGDDLREHWTARAAARRAPDPVCRRVSEDGRSEGGSLPRVARQAGADGPLRIPARSGDDRLPAGAHLTGERSDHQLHARRIATARGAARDEPRRRGVARHPGWRRDPRLQCTR